MISLDRLIHWLKTSGAGQITRYLCISAASLLTLSSWSQEPPIPQTISVSDEEMATATPAQLEAWANEGQSKAQFSLGLAYYNGTVVEQDMEKAAQWFQLAAEAGHPNAQYNLGVLHVQGQGVDKDFRKAAKWFRAAADQGETTSQYNMGIFHLNGLGVPADPAESLRYFSLAAAQGDTRSQFQLGVAIARGEGIAQNFPEAYLWINLAAKKGHQEAMSALNELLGLMTPEDLFAGRLLNAERGDADDQFEVAMAHAMVGTESIPVRRSPSSG